MTDQTPIASSTPAESIDASYASGDHDSSTDSDTASFLARHGLPVNSVGNASDDRGLLVDKSVGSASASSASASSAMSVDESARLSSLNLGDMELT